MTRDEIIDKLLTIFEEEFEIVDPDLDANLREEHGFDSIDAISLLEILEDMLNDELTQNEKKDAMLIENINQIADYIENLIKVRKK